jgi:hypothetical protein
MSSVIVKKKKVIDGLEKKQRLSTTPQNDDSRTRTTRGGPATGVPRAELLYNARIQKLGSTETPNG